MYLLALIPAFIVVYFLIIWWIRMFFDSKITPIRYDIRHVAIITIVFVSVILLVISIPDEEFANAEDTSETSNPIKIIRFTSDGFIGDKSPAAVILRQRTADDAGEGHAIAIAQSATRLNYEIRTVQQPR